MSKHSILLVVALAGSVLGQVVSYEGLAFPEDEGEWVRRDLPFLADRWLMQDDEGVSWLVQHADVVDQGPPQEGEWDLYDHSLADLDDLTTLHVQWRMYTDGSSEGIPGVSPAALVAGGSSGVFYHFTLADDRVRFVRDVLLPPVFVDVAPLVPHVYRLEVYGDQLYRWYVDNTLVDSGVPEGPYPTDDSVIAFGVHGGFDDETTKWDYIRFGVIPDAGSGDMTGDGAVGLDDFRFFQECVDNSGPGIDGGPGCAWADMDQDDDVDFHDLRLFQLAFTGSD